MSFATNLHHQAVEYVQMLVLDLNESVAQSKVKEQSPADRLQAFAQKTKLSTESTMLFEVLPLDGAPTRLRLPTGGGPRCLAWISTEPNSPNLTPARLHILWAFSPCSVMLNGALIAFLRGVTWPHVFTFRGISAFLLAK
jgi:hypothetical protein